MHKLVDTDSRLILVSVLYTYQAFTTAWDSVIALTYLLD
jgi:hypothetical protein